MVEDKNPPSSPRDIVTNIIAVWAFSIGPVFFAIQWYWSSAQAPFFVGVSPLFWPVLGASVVTAILHFTNKMSFYVLFPIISVLMTLRHVFHADRASAGIFSYMISSQCGSLVAAVLITSPSVSAVLVVMHIVLVIFLYVGRVEPLSVGFMAEKEVLAVIFALVNIGVVATAIPYLNRSQQQLAQHKEDLLAGERKLNESKTEFLRRICHELRTPMVGILSLSEIALKENRAGKSPAQLNHDLKTIVSSSSQVIDVLNSILTFDNLSTGIEIDRRPTSISGIFDTIMQHNIASASDHDVRLVSSFQVSCNVPAGQEGDIALSLDRSLVTQGLQALISSVIRCSYPEATVGVCCHIDENEVRFRVSSSGIRNIVASDLETVIHPTEDSLGANVPGKLGSLGIAVALNRELAKFMDGTLTAHISGDALTFEVTFTGTPRCRSTIISSVPHTQQRDMSSSVNSAVVAARDGDEPASTPARRIMPSRHAKSKALADIKLSSPVRRSSRRSIHSSTLEATSVSQSSVVRPRVLLAEDNPVTRKIFERQCHLVGAEVVSCADGGIALDVILHENPERPFHLCVFDLQMPVYNGIELVERVRQHDESRHRRVVYAFSAIVQDGDIDAIVTPERFDGFLRKPAKVQDLRDILAKCSYQSSE